MISFMDTLLDLDRRIFLILNRGPWPSWMDSFFIGLTRDGTLAARLIVLALFAFLLWRSPAWRRRALWLLPLVAVSDSLTSRILKELFARPRPCRDALEGMRLLVGCGPAYSFPSSHAANMGAAGFFLALGARRTGARIAILIPPLLVAYSRIHVGVHYPLDVLAGWTEGAFLALLWDALLKRLPGRIRLLRAGERPVEETRRQ